MGPVSRFRMMVRSSSPKPAKVSAMVEFSSPRPGTWRSRLCAGGGTELVERLFPPVGYAHTSSYACRSTRTPRRPSRVARRRAGQVVAFLGWCCPSVYALLLLGAADTSRRRSASVARLLSAGLVGALRPCKGTELYPIKARQEVLGFTAGFFALVFGSFLHGHAARARRIQLSCHLAATGPVQGSARVTGSL